MAQTIGFTVEPCEGVAKQQRWGSLLDLGLATLDLILSRMDFLDLYGRGALW